MNIGPTHIEETYAEAFGMRYVALLVTAHDAHWLDAAAREFTGYSSSVIACDAETGVARWLSPEQTPDGRPGAELLAFGFSTDALAKAAANRTGQCLMTCPSTAVFDASGETPARASAETIPLGKHVRFFGDGFQKSKLIGSTRYWRVPVMDGEFLVVDTLRVGKGVAGGNIVIEASSQQAALDAARRGVEAVAAIEGAITPFPGGVARSGSKVGSRYKQLVASTADAYCPTLRGRAPTKLRDGVNCALEIVIDGVDADTVARAMRAAIYASAGDEVLAISAGNYGGKLGKHHFHLRELCAE